MVIFLTTVNISLAPLCSVDIQVCLLQRGLAETKLPQIQCHHYSLTLCEETNSKSFSGFSIARKVFALNDMLH